MSKKLQYYESKRESRNTYELQDDQSGEYTSRTDQQLVDGVMNNVSVIKSNTIVKELSLLY